MRLCGSWELFPIMSSSYLSERVRQEVIQRAASRCEYCGSSLNFCPDPFSIEHIIPRAAEGTDAPDNLALSCQGCNNFKGIFVEGVDPITGDQSPLYHPRRHRWSEHFCWSEDALMILGLTPTGRATVERLALNRNGVVNLRGLLVLVGKHPP